MSAEAGGPPRGTPDGHPDLQGAWVNDTITPLQRPKDLADEHFFSTAAEAAAWAKHARDRAEDEGPALERKVTGEPADVWAERGGVVPTLRTALVIDPEDGQVPLTDAMKKSMAARRANADAVREIANPEELLPPERCLVWGPGAPMLPRPYNAGLQIVQTPDYLLISLEMIHDARIVPLDGSRHLPVSMRRWQGDSRGHWDGDTLVIETTNFTDKTRLFGSTVKTKVTERLSRPSEGTLLYQFTVENPDLFTRPWTAEIPLRHATAPFYEYACHEANYSMEGMLRAPRAQK